MKNARQNVQESLQHIKSAQCCINEALNSVEKQGNKQLIQNVESAVGNCENQIQNCLNNYKESEK